MVLLSEYCDNALKRTVKESANGERETYISGIFMQAEQENRNKRVYPRKVLQDAVGKYVQEQVSTGRAVGELNHPDGPNINLDKVSHRITELYWEGDNVMGKALVLDETPMGKIVIGLLKGGVKLGVSSRGMGTVEQRGSTSIVRDDYLIATVDIVQDPSAPSAFVNGILEGVNWKFVKNQLVAERLDITKKNLKKMNSKQIAEAQARILKNFLRDISRTSQFLR